MASRADWSRLGLEPTVDVRAIKRAYASKVRLTRPDDDAAAYQALREAYERVQAWASRQAMVAAMRDEDEAALDDERSALAVDVVRGEAHVDSAHEAHVDKGHDAHDVAADEAQVPAALLHDTRADARRDALSVEPAPHAADHADRANADRARPPYAAPARVGPYDLVHRLDAAWHTQGEAAWFDAWPAARDALEQLPLAAGDTASLAFAAWILETPDASVPIVTELCRHFGWFTDYRSGHALGAARMHELHARLRSPAPATVVNADPRTRWHPRMLLRRLAAMSWIASTLRAVAWAGVMVLVAWLAGVPRSQLGEMMALVFSLVFAFWAPVYITALFLRDAARRRARERRLAEGRLHDFRRRARGGATGLLLLAMPVVIDPFVPKESLQQHEGVLLGVVLAVIACWAVGIWLAWPKTTNARWTLYGSAILASMALSPWMKDASNMLAMTAGVWCALAGSWLCEHRIATRAEKGSRGWESLVGWLLLLCAPVFLTQVIAQRRSCRTALAPGVLAGSVGHFAALGVFWTLFLWTATACVVLFVFHVIDEGVRRRAAA